MTQEHPITPPPELVRHWSRFQGDTNSEALWFRIANCAAQWGADQELEACCLWVNSVDDDDCFGANLRAARRPKPPSLKEQALQALSEAVKMADDVPPEGICSGQADIIRRALEQLDD